MKISSGCDTSGMIAARLGDEAAKLTGGDKVDVKSKGDARKLAETKPTAPAAK